MKVRRKLTSPLAKQPESAEELKTVLDKEGIREFAQDIRTMSKAELIRNFSYKKNDKINVTLLIKNLIWQACCCIRQGKLAMNL